MILVNIRSTTETLNAAGIEGMHDLSVSFKERFIYFIILYCSLLFRRAH